MILKILTVFTACLFSEERRGLSEFKYFHIWIAIPLFHILIPFGLHAAPVNIAKQAVSRTENAVQLDVLIKSIDESIQSEKETAKDLKAELVQSVSLKKDMADEINAYNVQQTTFSNQLFLPQIQIRNLQNAFDLLQISFATIDKRVKDLIARHETLAKLHLAADEQFVVVSNQLSNIKGTGSRKTTVAINKKLRLLRDLVSQKQVFYKNLQSFYAERIKQFGKLKQTFSDSSLEYKKILAKQESRNLFQQDVSLFSRFWPLHIKNITSQFSEQIREMVVRDYWSREIIKIQRTDSYDFVSFFSLLLLVFVCCWRLSRLISDIRSKEFFKRHSSFSLPLSLVQRGLFQLGIAIYLYFYLEIAGRSGMSSLLNLLIDLLTVALFTGWGLQLIDFQTFKNISRQVFVRRIRLMVLFIRWYAGLFLILSWVFGHSSLVLLAGRVILELSLIGFGFSIWSIIRSPKYSVSQEAGSHTSSMVVALAILIISISGLILETAGFGSLAFFWYQSWGRSAIVWLWSTLLFAVLKELNTNLIDRENEGREKENIASYQGRWILIRLFQMLGPLFVILALILAWGGKQAILSNTFFVLSYRFQIGSMSFSLFSFFGAILILLATHVFTRLWRYIFQKRFLHRSHMELGLQDSITTITVYLIWVLGLITALNLFGLNPTSLMVIFGALGIGLGFGLQSIFNNFMSGLILLFERPIQVGDDIEINGIWATVKKINVRSTLVQTYDNASLIIPNSDLINNQVTNWSFKDKRLRRQVTVGVAYGSDIELVRESLLEIAKHTPEVLSYPTPEVLFTDFGDSALIFKLRIWTHIGYIFTVETDIRFRIDRLFKERNIVIAFPQRDVHLYMKDKKSDTADLKRSDEKPEEDGSTPDS